VLKSVQYTQDYCCLYE